jgi:hypothetical protein
VGVARAAVVDVLLNSPAGLSIAYNYRRGKYKLSFALTGPLERSGGLFLPYAYNYINRF